MAMAGSLQAHLASLQLVPPCTQPWSTRAPLSSLSTCPIASTSQCCWGAWQPAPPLHRPASSQATAVGSEERGLGASGCAAVFGCNVGSFGCGQAALSYTERDARRRGDVVCAAGKRVAKKKKAGAGGAGAGPRESPAILLRRSAELYETLMRPELLDEGLVREYVVCARLQLGEAPLPEAARNLDLLQDWLPIAELAFLSMTQEDNVADILPRMKREVCECVLRAVPQAKNVPRNMLEYAYEKKASFVKYVLENVDATSREEAPSGEDPFAVLGLTRGATSQQVRTAYRAMAAIYHPDRNPAADAAGKYMQVTKAYEQLKAGGGAASAGFSAYAAIGGRERDDLHGPIDISPAAKQVGEGREIAVRPLDEEIVVKFTARAHAVAMKRGAMVERSRRAQAVPA